MSSFDILPFDIVNIIISDLVTMVMMRQVCKQFNGYYSEDKLLPELRKELYERTRLNVTNYDIQQLIQLYKMQFVKIIASGHLSTIVRRDGKVYAFGSIDNKKDLPLSWFDNMNHMSNRDSKLLIARKDGKVFWSEASGLQPKVGGFRSEGNKLSEIISIYNFHVTQVAMGLNYSLMLINTGSVFTLRYSDDLIIPVLTLLHKINNIVQVAMGECHSLLLTQDGDVYAFGNNFYGQLGLGNGPDRSEATLVSTLIDIVQICTGYSHSVALTRDGDVYTFG